MELTRSVKRSSETSYIAYILSRSDALILTEELVSCVYNISLLLVLFIIKCKKLTSLQHRVRATNSHIQNSKNHFTRPS